MVPKVFSWLASPMTIVVMGVIFSDLASAQNNFDLDILNPGEILVNLNVSEQAQVEQDTLHATLYYSAQGRDRVALQDEVNRTITGALELLEDSDIQYSTQGYRVYQVRPDRPIRNESENLSWRAQQGVQLTDQDSGIVLDLVAELQNLGLTLSGLNYSLSPARQEEVSDSLMEAALNRLRGRADAAAAALGKSGVEIIEISMNNNNGGAFRSASMSFSVASEQRDVATPVAEPGLTTVVFTVSARVILLP